MTSKKAKQLTIRINDFYGNYILNPWDYTSSELLEANLTTYDLIKEGKTQGLVDELLEELEYIEDSKVVAEGRDLVCDLMEVD